METYEEYPVRCKTCNEQLACFSSDYNALLQAGLTQEEALNQLNIMNYCSRIAMMNPTIVAFNMENREVIEGFKNVDAATEEDAQRESTSRPVFSSCIGLQAGPPLLGEQMVPPRVQALPIRPATLQLPVQPLTQRTQEPFVPIQIARPQPVATGIVKDINIEDLGVGIPVKDAVDITKFREPTAVGVPTINPDPTIPQERVYVGAGKHVEMLNGCTYLAR